MVKKTVDLINFMVGKVEKLKNGKVKIVLVDLCKTELGHLTLIDDFGVDLSKIENLSLQQYVLRKKSKK